MVLQICNLLALSFNKLIMAFRWSLPIQNITSYLKNIQKFSCAMWTAFAQILQFFIILSHMVHQILQNQNKLKDAKAELYYMLDKGIIRPYDSCWSNPLHMVVKPNGDWIPCGDYHALNNITVANNYPLSYWTDFHIYLSNSSLSTRRT